MDNIPWLTISGATGGWVLFGFLAQLVLRKMISGDLLTRREADAMQTEINALREANQELLRQNGLLLRESLPTTNAVLAALHNAVEDTR